MDGYKSTKVPENEQLTETDSRASKGVGRSKASLDRVIGS